MPLTIDFYSDLLCIWGWIGQHHNQQLVHRWGKQQVQWRHRYLALYGDVFTRLKAQEKGEQAWEGYAAMSERLVDKIEGLSVNPDIWRKTRPTTSMMAHQAIKAAELCHGIEFANDFSCRVRSAFFAEARDISQYSVLLELLQEHGAQHVQVVEKLQSGEALAACISEFRQAEQDKIPGSPTWVMDNNRYRLFGNVKPEIIAATIDGLLKD